MSGNDPAFPTENPLGPGMTKREYFAAAALTGLITLATDRSAQEYAADCVKMADALIRELEGGE